MRYHALALTLFILSCTSGGDALRKDGFTANPAGSRSWWVSYEADSASSARAHDALLYNTARLVLDKGGVYFTLEESKTDSRFEHEQSSVINDPDFGDPTFSDSRRARTTLQRVVSINAIAEIVDEPREGALDAAKVLEELTRKYSR